MITFHDKRAKIGRLCCGLERPFKRASGETDSKITCIDARGATCGRETAVEPERRIVEVL